eukprot:COSAG05_NODE_1083_length_5933_cov_3.284196_11_plen_72_part_01
MRELQQKGEEALAADKPEEAMSYFDQALKLAPHSALADEMSEKNSSAVPSHPIPPAGPGFHVKRPIRKGDLG